MLEYFFSFFHPFFVPVILQAASARATVAHVRRNLRFPNLGLPRRHQLYHVSAHRPLKGNPVRVGRVRVLANGPAVERAVHVGPAQASGQLLSSEAKLAGLDYGVHCFSLHCRHQRWKRGYSVDVADSEVRTQWFLVSLLLGVYLYSTCTHTKKTVSHIRRSLKSIGGLISEVLAQLKLTPEFDCLSCTHELTEATIGDATSWVLNSYSARSTLGNFQDIMKIVSKIPDIHFAETIL